MTANVIYNIRDPQLEPAIHEAFKEDYFMMNLKTDYFLPALRSGIFVQVDNIFDHQGQDLLGSALPGRWLSGGFRIHFK